MKRTTFTVGMPPYTFSRMGRVLDSGESSKVMVSASRPGAGIRLFRGDVASRDFVPAHFRHITETRPVLVIGRGSVEVASAEALLAALYAAGAWGTDVKVFSRDIPNMDGTLMAWVDALKDADLYREGGGADRVFTLSEATQAEGLTWSFSAKPSRTPSLEVRFDHPNKGIGKQSFKLPLTQAAIEKELGTCRPIRVLGELNVVEERVLRELAELGHVLLFEADGAPAEGVTLQQPDEVARRVALEGVASLALLGAPLMADIQVKGASLQAYRELTWHLGSSNRTHLDYAG